MSHFTLVKNIFANVCRGGSAALVTLLLPPFLTRILSKDAYGTWLLILQLSTYVSFLDFGIQTAVGRYVAHYNEIENASQRDSVVSTCLAILTALGSLAMIGVITLAWHLPNLLKDMPVDLHQDAQLALLAVGGSLAVSLPFSVFGGIFIGLQRYDIPAWIIGISKLFGGLLVVIIANHTHSILMMALMMGMTNILSGISQFLASKRFAGYIKISIKLLSKKTTVEIIRYCSVIVLWYLGITLVSGLDTVIIGYFDYKYLAAYNLAASLTTFLVSIPGAIFSTLIPMAAAMSARNEKQALGELVLSMTRYAIILLVLICLPVILGSKWILNLWVGQNYADQANELLQLLMVANLIRQIGYPYSVIAVAIGEQEIIMLSPLLEGIVNFSVSIFLITQTQIGVLSVAIGTLIGGIVSVYMHLFHNLPRSKKVFSPGALKIAYTCGTSLAALTFPGLISWAFHMSNISFTPQIIDIFIFCVTIIFTLSLVYSTAITSEERQKILSVWIKSTKKS